METEFGFLPPGLKARRPGRSLLPLQARRLQGPGRLGSKTRISLKRVLETPSGGGLFAETVQKTLLSYS